MSRVIRSLAALLLCLITLSAPASSQQVPASSSEIKLSFAPVVERTRPAVVNIFAKSIVRARRPRGGPDSLFRFFFDDDLFGGLPRERVKNSLGSGVIVDPSGLVVTNYHVIRNTNDIRVVLADKRAFKAKVVLSHERSDLAVLKIKAGKALPYLELGDSDRLKVGDLVLAIGNPFGVGQTVTSGIVSALARSRLGISSYQFFIQTDAAINPGNSGGALVDMAGRLVGINTAIYSRTGGYQGIGFAIPANMVASVIASARKGGHVVRLPWSGARLQNITPDLARPLKLTTPSGALVADLHPRSPLAAAGVKRGDVIVAVDGKPVDGVNAFNFQFATGRLGKTARLDLVRRGRKVAVTVKLIPPPEDPPRNETVLRGRSPFDGLIVANLSPAVAEELGLASTVSRGVVVLGVRQGFAAQVGLFRKGDIIVELNGARIATVRDLKKQLARANGFWQGVVNRRGRLRRFQLGG